MGLFPLLATVLLFGFSLFVLGRANGWSRLRSSLVATGSIFVPVAAVLVTWSMPLPAYVQDSVAGVAAIAVMIVLYALCRAVADKVAK